MCVSKDNLLNQAKEANHTDAVPVVVQPAIAISSTNWSQIFRKVLILFMIIMLFVCVLHHCQVSVVN